MIERLDITDEEYFALPHASNSSMREAHKLFMANEKGEFDPTRAYRFGSAFDALSTAPGELSLVDMTDKEVSLLMPMRRKLELNGIYRSLFKDQPTQVVFVRDDLPVKIDGVERKIPARCKFDVWNERFNFGGDLKSTTAKTAEQFYAAFKHFQYHAQAAWYMDVTKTDRFVVIGVPKETDLKYAAQVIQVKRDDDLYNQGRAIYTRNARSWWMMYGVKASGK